MMMFIRPLTIRLHPMKRGVLVDIEKLLTQVNWGVRGHRDEHQGGN